MRRFLRWPKSRGAQCRYFMWLEEEKANGYQQLPPRSQQVQKPSSALEVPVPGTTSSSDSEQIIQERQQQREGCSYFGRSKKQVIPNPVSSQRCDHQWSRRGTNSHVKMKTWQNLRSSRNHPSEDRSGHPQCPYRCQSTQEVDQVELQESLMYQLPSGVRKRIVGELKSRLQALETGISTEDSLEIDNKDLSEIMHLRLIGEVFSTPQFSRRAPQHDLQSGRALDLQLGDQFLKSEHRQQCLNHLRRMKYGFVAVSCPCYDVLQSAVSC